MLVQGKQLFGQPLNPVRSENDPLHQFDQTDFLVERRGFAASHHWLVTGHAGKAPVLRFGEGLEGGADLVKQLNHLVAYGVFHRRQRHIQIITVIAIIIGITSRGVGVTVTALIILILVLFFFGLIFILFKGVLIKILVKITLVIAFNQRATIQPRVGCLKINDVAQRNNAISDLVPPMQQGTDRQR